MEIGSKPSCPGLIIIRTPTNPTMTSRSGCAALARDILHGEGGPNGMAGHLWANYSYYTKQTTNLYPTNPVYVVRTHHLWYDLATIEKEGVTSHLPILVYPILFFS